MLRFQNQLEGEILLKVPQKYLTCPMLAAALLYLLNKSLFHWMTPFLIRSNKVYSSFTSQELKINLHTIHFLKVRATFLFIIFNFGQLSVTVFLKFNT